LLFRQEKQFEERNMKHLISGIALTLWLIALPSQAQRWDRDGLKNRILKSARNLTDAAKDFQNETHRNFQWRKISSDAADFSRKTTDFETFVSSPGRFGRGIQQQYTQLRRDYETLRNSVHATSINFRADDLLDAWDDVVFEYVTLAKVMGDVDGDDDDFRPTPPPPSPRPGLKITGSIEQAPFTFYPIYSSTELQTTCESFVVSYRISLVDDIFNLAVNGRLLPNRTNGQVDNTRTAAGHLRNRLGFWRTAPDICDQIVSAVFNTVRPTPPGTGPRPPVPPPAPPAPRAPNWIQAANDTPELNGAENYTFTGITREAVKEVRLKNLGGGSSYIRFRNVRITLEDDSVIEAFKNGESKQISAGQSVSVANLGTPRRIRSVTFSTERRGKVRLEALVEASNNNPGRDGPGRDGPGRDGPGRRP